MSTFTNCYDYAIHEDYKTRGFQNTQIGKVGATKKVMERCTECKKDLELNEENFHLHTKRKTGFQGICKPCQRKLRSVQDMKNPEKHDKTKALRRR